MIYIGATINIIHAHVFLSKKWAGLGMGVIGFKTLLPDHII
jgi:hypothetical protein